MQWIFSGTLYAVVGIMYKKYAINIQIEMQDTSSPLQGKVFSFYQLYCLEFGLLMIKQKTL